MELLTALQEYTPRCVATSIDYTRPWVHQLNVRLTPSDDTFEDALKSRILLSIGDAIDPMKSVKDETNNFVLEVIPRIKQALQTIEWSKLTRFYLTGDYNLTAVGVFTDTVLITYIKTLTESDGWNKKTTATDDMLYASYEKCCEEYFKNEEEIQCFRTDSGLIIRDRNDSNSQIKVFFCNDELAPKDGDLVLRLNDTLERIGTRTERDLKLTRPAIAEFYAVYRKYLPPEWCSFIRFCKYWAFIHLYAIPDNFATFLEVCCVKVLIAMSADTNTRSMNYVEAFAKVLETSFNKDTMKSVNSVLFPSDSFNHEMTHSENYTRYGRQPEVEVDWNQFNDNKIEFCGLIDRGLNLFDNNIAKAWKRDIGKSAKRIVKKFKDTGDVLIGDLFEGAYTAENQRNYVEQSGFLTIQKFILFMMCFFLASCFLLMNYVERDGTLASAMIDDTVKNIEKNVNEVTMWFSSSEYTQEMVNSSAYKKMKEVVGTLPAYWERTIPDNIKIKLGSYRNSSWRFTSKIYSQINLWFVALTGLKNSLNSHETQFRIPHFKKENSGVDMKIEPHNGLNTIDVIELDIQNGSTTGEQDEKEFPELLLEENDDYIAQIVEEIMGADDPLEIVKLLEIENLEIRSQDAVSVNNYK